MGASDGGFEMNERYSYKDVIIDPEDPRVEIGAEYYYG